MPILNAIRLVFAEFRVESTPQQTNGVDCGVYVVCIAEALLRDESFPKQAPRLLDAIKPDTVTVRRAELYDEVRRHVKERPPRPA